jgi:hypothetical protein
VTYLSVVMAGRNDGYGGDFLGRMRRSTSIWQALAWNAGLALEVIVVDWNGPEDRPSLESCLGVGGVRFIAVKTLMGVPRFPMLEYVAKNVGIKNARGEFVLATNPDIIPSPELVGWLSRYDLRERRFYRIDRRDTLQPKGESMGDFLRSCEENVFRVNKRLGRSLFSFGSLHTNACGDFTLMSKKDWERLRGYPEVVGPPHYVDSFLLLVAQNSGLRQMILHPPMKIFHIEHDREFRAKPMSLMPAALVPCYEKMRTTGEPVVLNGESWGLGL